MTRCNPHAWGVIVVRVSDPGWAWCRAAAERTCSICGAKHSGQFAYRPKSSETLAETMKQAAGGAIAKLLRAR